MTTPVDAPAERTSAAEAAFDPVMIEVAGNEFASLSEEMAIVIWKTGRSTMLKAGDFATALCDRDGHVIAEGFAAPFQLAVFETFVGEIANRFRDDLAPGDVVLSNDPLAGMTHLPDVGLVVPAFVGDEHVGFAVSYSHHSDAGGHFPGGMSETSTSLFEEGLRIPLVKLYDRGRLNEQLRDTISANVRAPSEWLGDLDAKVAGSRRGAQGLAALAERVGVAEFHALTQGMLEHGERALRQAVAALHDGEYVEEASIPLPTADGAAVEEARLALTLRVRGDELDVDFTGSSEQVPYGLNVPETMARAAICGGVKSIVATDAPANSGFFRPINVIAPVGSIVNPTVRAPISARITVFTLIFDLLFQALGDAAPAVRAVPGIAGDAIHLHGNSAEHGEFSALDMFFGGWGARADRDGIDGVAPVYMGSFGSTSVEILERKLPVVVEEFGLVPDTEGAGTYRGSLQVGRTWRLLEPADVMVRSLNLVGTAGMSGGLRGLPAQTQVAAAGGEERELAPRSHVHFRGAAGDRIRHVTASAGGFGDPLERDPADVHHDVVDGKISRAGAQERYGVVVREPDGEVDRDATVTLRNLRHEASDAEAAA